MSSVTLNHGDKIFNKADGITYTYDAVNHKFIKPSGTCYYVVDFFLDYVGASVPSSINSKSYELTYKSDSDDRQAYGCVYYKPSYDGIFYSPAGSTAANILSEMTDDACIYQWRDPGSNDSSYFAARVIHTLNAGDIIYNKSDGCTYMYTIKNNVKAFEKIYQGTMLPPVEEIVFIDSDVIASPQEGDKCIVFWPSSQEYRGYYYTYTDSAWDEDNCLYNGEIYASSNTHKFYGFNDFYGAGIPFLPRDIPVGVPFLNKADNHLYVFDGTNIVKTGT